MRPVIIISVVLIPEPAGYVAVLEMKLLSNHTREEGYQIIKSTEKFKYIIKPLDVNILMLMSKTIK